MNVNQGVPLLRALLTASLCAVLRTGPAYSSQLASDDALAQARGGWPAEVPVCSDWNGAGLVSHPCPNATDVFGCRLRQDPGWEIPMCEAKHAHVREWCGVAAVYNPNGCSESERTYTYVFILVNSRLNEQGLRTCDAEGGPPATRCDNNLGWASADLACPTCQTGGIVIGAPPPR